MPQPGMLTFRDVLITPYVGRPPYRRGGPHWPEWSTQTTARYCMRGVPHDDEPPEADPTSTLTGPLAWAGAVTWHFGHQIVNFSTRLLPTLAQIPDARFAFSMHANRLFRTIDETPPFFRDILAWYGIARERVDLIAEPTAVQRLVVAPQAEQTPRPGPEPWYLDLQDSNTTSRLGEIDRNGSLYVSRAGQRGRFAGEMYVEGAMERAGFRVLRPETVSLEEQLRAYAGAESIVFAEGSAMHGAQLMGRSLGDVTVLTRRSGMKLGQAALRPRSRSLRHVDAVRSLLHGLDMDGNPALYDGLSLLDAAQLQTALPIGDAWEREAFEAAVDADVTEWLETEQTSPRWQVSGAPEVVTEGLRRAGLAH